MGQLNVDLLELIQVGLTFLDKNGKPRENTSTWQFNFKFNLEEDIYAQDSIELLQNAGLDFQRHFENGIDAQDFGEALMMSGVVLNEEVRWIAFHGSYDFAYMTKILTGHSSTYSLEYDQPESARLPNDEGGFFE